MLVEYIYNNSVLEIKSMIEQYFNKIGSHLSIDKVLSPHDSKLCINAVIKQVYDGFNVDKHYKVNYINYKRN